MDEFLNDVIPYTAPTDAELQGAFREWEHNQRTCKLTWDDRFALQRLIVAARPDVRSLIADFSNYELLEEAQCLGIEIPGAVRH